MIAQGDLRILIAIYERKNSEIAKAAGISESRVRAILGGARLARPETIERIERAIVYADRPDTLAAFEAMEAAQ